MTMSSTPAPGNAHAAPRATRFLYRAALGDGTVHRGVVTADSREAAARVLTAQGLLPVALRPAWRTAGTMRLSPRDAALGLRPLATLLEAGLPLARALAALPDLAPPVWAAVLPATLARVREGASLARALEASETGLPPVVLGVIQAGESGSGLAPAVARAAELLEESAATRAAIRGALAYPCILAGAGAASVALLVGVVLPRFAAMLADLGQALPPSTRLVLSAASMARHWALPATGLGGLGVLLWHRWAKSPEGAQAWHGLLLRIPLLGSIRLSAATARVAAALAALLESGVPVAPALSAATRAAGDAAIGARCRRARERILEGARPSAACAAEGALTPTTIRLIRAGEESGHLARMLQQAARLEREQASERVKALVRVLEPGLILVFGGLIALVAAALLQAMYSIRPT
jgi:general secretion pathway protein F